MKKLNQFFETRTKCYAHEYYEILYTASRASSLDIPELKELNKRKKKKAAHVVFYDVRSIIRDQRARALKFGNGQINLSKFHFSI